ncbi:MAG: hypothetical protein GC186_13350 [Rhodobacteraceae bacterium]|nr:hypothetical protein [Paracoccaceae bacterium]
MSRLLTGFVVLAVVLAVGAWFTRDKWHLSTPGSVTVVAGGQQLEAVGEAGHETLSAFVNIPGDPMTLHLDTAAPQDRGISTIDRPATLPADRGAGPLTLVQDVMISGQERVVTTLPSSQEDFAVFQAQRRGLQGAAIGGADTGTTPAPVSLPVDAATKATTLSVSVLDGNQRHPLTEDVVIRLTSTRPVADVLRENRITPAEADEISAAVTQNFGLTALDPGEVLALRGLSGAKGAALSFRQLSIYKADRGYVGSLARADDTTGPDSTPQPGGLVPGADPWVQVDLFANAATDAAPAPARHYRVLDALYSAALRDQLPSTLVGQIIMLLSEAHDLDVDAVAGDHMTLLYSPDPGSSVPGIGQVLYIAIKGANVTVDCYVYPPSPGADYACYGRSKDQGGPAVRAPQPAPAAAAPAPAGTPTESNDAAVSQLVDRIITIESGGNATAKNPLSGATGAGQFIGSTWLRMMRTYRPDLVIANTPEQLLAMRNDPEISRQMVFLLAKEGEAYLRARGHEITAGRLYLAHFLGMEGANVVLSAPPDSPLLPLIGQPAITANPFLDGQTTTYVIDWAEQKMSGAAATVAFREPAGLDTFRTLVASMLPTG